MKQEVLGEREGGWVLDLIEDETSHLQWSPEDCGHFSLPSLSLNTDSLS